MNRPLSSSMFSIGCAALAGTNCGRNAKMRSRPTKDHALLAVDGVIDNHMSPRPHLPLRGRLTGPNLRASPRPAAMTAGPLPALTLGPLTAVDDPGYYKALGVAANLRADVRDGLTILNPQ